MNDDTVFSVIDDVMLTLIPALRRNAVAAHVRNDKAELKRIQTRLVKLIQDTTTKPDQS